MPNRVRGTLLLAVLMSLLASGCDSGQPSGEALQSQSPALATRAPEDPRVFPTGEAVPTLTAISAQAANSTPVSVNDDIPSANLDACTLLTEEEAEAATGLTLKPADYMDPKAPGAKCRYEAEGTAVSLKVFAARDEAEAARIWSKKYTLYLHPQIGAYSQYVEGVGDAALIYLERTASSDIMSQQFWHMVAKRGTMYFELLWLTDSPDPTSAMTEMGRKIVSRL